MERADSFARQNTPCASPHLYASYKALLENSNVDIVYIATPHAFHLQNALAAIEAGKYVLVTRLPLNFAYADTENKVEILMAVNLKQAAMMVDRARAKGVCLVEGAKQSPLHDSREFEILIVILL